MNDNHNSLHDELDEALDRAIRAAKAQPSPPDVKMRVLETAATWQRKVPIAVDDLQRAAHDALAEVEKEFLPGSEALAHDTRPVEQSILGTYPKSIIRGNTSGTFFMRRSIHPYFAAS